MDKLNANISLKDTDIFKDILEVIKEFTHDERVSEEVRQEYISKLQGTIDREGIKSNGTKTT